MLFIRGGLIPPLLTLGGPRIWYGAGVRILRKGHKYLIISYYIMLYKEAIMMYNKLQAVVRNQHIELKPLC